MIRTLGSAIKYIVSFLFRYDFFISYAHADGTEYAEHLRDALEDEPYKFSVHLDSRDFGIGEDLGFLTQTRVRGSRMLVVVARMNALTRSKWVRDEVDIFVERGRNPVIIDVADVVAQAPVVSNRLSEWIAQNPNTLRLSDPGPEELHRCAPSEVIDRIAGTFDGVRTRVVRERLIALAFLVLTAISAVAIWQAYEAFVAEKQAQSRAFAAAAYSYSDRDPTLALRLAQRASDFYPLGGTGRRAVLRAYNSGSWFYDHRIDDAIGSDLSTDGNLLGYILDDVVHLRELKTGTETTMPAAGASIRVASNGNVVTWSGFQTETTVTIRTAAGVSVAQHNLGRSVTAVDCGNDVIAIPAFTRGGMPDDANAQRIELHLINIESGTLTTRAMPRQIDNLGLHGACARGGQVAVFAQTIPSAMAVVNADGVRMVEADISGFRPVHASISPDGRRAAAYLAGAVKGTADGILSVAGGANGTVKNKVLPVRESPSFDSGGRILFLDNRRILVASTDGWLQIIDPEINERVMLTDRNRAADALAVAPTTGVFVVARRSGTATVYSPDGAPIASLIGTPISDSKNPAFLRLSFDKRGRSLLAATRDGVRTWRPRKKPLTIIREPKENWFEVPAHPFRAATTSGQLARRCGGTRDGFGIDDAGVASQCFALAGQQDKLPTQFLKSDLQHLSAISSRDDHIVAWLGTKFARFFVLDPDWALNDSLKSEKLWAPKAGTLNSYIR